jgi:glutathione S-transferase
MTITITAFERSPNGRKGLARDTRVRWAPGEMGQPYEVRLLSFRAMKEPAHLCLSARDDIYVRRAQHGGTADP